MKHYTKSTRSAVSQNNTWNVKSVHPRTILSNVGHSVLLCYIMAISVTIGWFCSLFNFCSKNFLLLRYYLTRTVNSVDMLEQHGKLSNTKKTNKLCARGVRCPTISKRTIRCLNIDIACYTSYSFYFLISYLDLCLISWK